jgi:hypothetical protein
MENGARLPRLLNGAPGSAAPSPCPACARFESAIALRRPRRRPSKGADALAVLALPGRFATHDTHVMNAVSGYGAKTREGRR